MNIEAENERRLQAIELDIVRLTGMVRRYTEDSVRILNTVRELALEMQRAGLSTESAAYQMSRNTPLDN